MQVSYAVEVKHVKKLFYPTLKVYTDAVKYCCRVFDAEWDLLAPLNGVYRKREGEKLIHTTKGNTAKYPFDQLFCKMPSYMRRSVTATALGMVSSYRSNYRNWEEKGKHGNPPRLGMPSACFPSFYKGNTFSDLTDNSCKLKLFVNNDWNWQTVALSKADVKYINNKLSEGFSMSVPTLEKRHRKWFLRFCFTKASGLPDLPDISSRRVLSVDLGLNADAVCSVVDARGTVLGRRFIDFPCDKDRITRLLGRLKGIQQRYGSSCCMYKDLWSYVRHLNASHAKKVAEAIAAYAGESQCHVTAFEHLTMHGKKRYRNWRQRLSLWRKKDILHTCGAMLHKRGIRYATVCAWNTSKLAFDGSGEILRGNAAGFANNKLCRFQNGKTYNCDLSASYNIAARYFVKHITESVPEMERCRLTAEVPAVCRRSRLVLADLWRLDAAMTG